MILAPDEWRTLEGGLRQQARLINAIAADLYGARRLLSEALVPPALVFGHRGFLRGGVGARPPNGTFVHVAAFDLARGPEGQWHVMGVRVQAPSGLGYALENRAAIARLFPDALRELHVRPTGPVADLVLHALTAHAPSDRDAPRAVMLTPGPYNETYFEHLYLARQLGLTIVQGGDLTVRQDRVFLKTVGGLWPVHAIWRRVDDHFCDPLELRSDSTLGVAGLLQAWRSGRVLVANGFGLGVLESPALLPHLPGLAMRLLGEPLRLPIVPTWWHMSRDGVERLASTLTRGVIKPALTAAGVEPVFGRLLDADARSSWMNRLESNPSAYVVQDFVPLSHAPVWENGRLHSRGLMVRMFLVTDGQSDYHVLPAALTRVALGGRLSVSAQHGGVSKDTWVMAGAPAPDGPAAAAPREASAAQVGLRVVTSRAAEHLFWLGRYAERSENAARLTRTILVRLTSGHPVPPAVLACMVQICGEEGLLTAEELRGAFSDPDSVPAPAFIAALAEGVFDRTRRTGLGFNVAQTTRVAGSVRERLSYDNWRVLAQLARRLTRRRLETSDVDATLEIVDDAILSLVAAGGLEMAHMTRDDGWRFLSLGRHLERLSFVSTTLISAASGSGTADPALLDWVLDLSDSLLTYRARYRRLPDWTAVVDLLLFDGRNPRALLFQVAKLAKHVGLLPGDALSGLVREIEALEQAQVSALDDVSSHLREAGEPAGAEPDDARIGLLLLACRTLAHRVSDALTLQYFSHVYDLPHATVNP
jgi:uncharacterized circularly permuted ATP-grasp superfamily protein/uncharacterized alpha-E superfamily protein